MRQDLPPLDQPNLNRIFEHVYDVVHDGVPSHANMRDDRLSGMIAALQAMQYFNFRYRSNDINRLFPLTSPIFGYKRSADGTSLWLALIVAVQELYSLTDEQLLQEVLPQVTIRK